MALEDLSSALKTWWDNKVKSPYFINVIIVWIFLNKGLVFGVFNFTDDLKFADRCLWAWNKISAFDVWGFTGFYGSVWLAVLIGFVSMTLFNILNGLASSIYHLSNSLATWFEKRSNGMGWTRTAKYLEVAEALEKTSIRLREVNTSLYLENEKSVSIQAELKEKYKLEHQLRTQLLEEQNRARALNDEVSNKKRSLLEVQQYKMKPMEFLAGKWEVNTRSLQSAADYTETYQINTHAQLVINGDVGYTVLDERILEDYILFSKEPPSGTAARTRRLVKLVAISDRILMGFEYEPRDSEYFTVSFKRLEYADGSKPITPESV